MIDETHMLALTEILNEITLEGDVYVDPKYPDLVKAAKVLEKAGLIREEPDPLPDSHFLFYYVANT